MVQNSKILSRMLLASFAILSIGSSFTTTTLADTPQPTPVPISLTIRPQSASIIRSVLIHNTTTNKKKPCIDITLPKQDSYDVPSSFSSQLSDKLHIQVFLSEGCKGRQADKSNIQGSLSNLLGKAPSSLLGKTRSFPQTLDGIELEQKGQQTLS